MLHHLKVVRWGWAVPTATVVPAIIALITFLASVPFSPARFWAGQLRRQGEVVQALDPERHANQRDVLLGRVDELANKAAAAQHIPTPWKRYVGGAVIWTYWAWLIVILVWKGPNAPPGVPDLVPPGIPGWIFAISFLLLMGWLGLRWTLVYAVNNHRERAKFIEQGCPPDFVPRPHLHARIRANEEAELATAVNASRPYRPRKKNVEEQHHASGLAAAFASGGTRTPSQMDSPTRPARRSTGLYAAVSERDANSPCAGKLPVNAPLLRA